MVAGDPRSLSFLTHGCQPPVKVEMGSSSQPSTSFPFDMKVLPTTNLSACTLSPCLSKAPSFAPHRASLFK